MLELVVSPPKLRLLRYLHAHDGSFTGRELARAVGSDPKRRNDEAEVKLAGLHALLTDPFGHPPLFLVMTKDDFRRRVRRGNSLLGEIVEQGRVLAGRPMAELIGRA